MVESMTSIFILTMGVIAFTPLALFTSRSSNQASLRSVALGYAKKQLDELKQSSFSLLPSGTVDLTVPADVMSSLPVTQNSNYAMKAQYSVTPSSEPTLKQISIRVWWQSVGSSVSGVDVSPTSEVRLSEVVAVNPIDLTLTVN